tara:strand:+ start:4987 stop:6198 length:1212 start_codon:yes stop_codon:yes gene_type:complete
MSSPNNLEDTTPDAANAVSKRMVFYFSGYDPRGASHYHKLYSAESEIQGALNNLDLDVGKRRRVHRLSNAWKIFSRKTGTETDYEFLRWDDIIRKNWPKNELQLLVAMVPSYWEFLKANWFCRLFKVSWTSALTAAYPGICFAGLLFFTLMLAAIVLMLPITLNFYWWAGIIPSVAVLAGGIKLGRWLDDRMHSYWQLRTHCAMQKWSYGDIPELDERIDEFAEYIIERIRSGDADEVLVVGHSAATILGVALVAKMQELDPDLGKDGPEFAFVSLANCLPLVTFLPGAHKLREDLRVLAGAPFIKWFDFSARRDGACVSVGDLVTMAGVSREQGAPVWPRRVPVSIVKMFPPESYAIIKKDLFRVHFQYIMAADLMMDYDYFAITAGPLKLASRYAETPLTH